MLDIFNVTPQQLLTIAFVLMFLIMPTLIVKFLNKRTVSSLTRDMPEDLAKATKELIG